MLIYQNPKQNGALYGTFGNIPDYDNDQPVCLFDLDGDQIDIGTSEGDVNRYTKFIDDGNGGIMIASDKKFVGVFIGDTATTQYNVIPGNWQPEEKEIKSIRVKTKPTKLTYSVGDTLDLTGMVIEATYSDGDKAVLTEGYTTDPADGDTLSTAGQVTVTVTASSKTATFKVTVE